MAIMTRTDGGLPGWRLAMWGVVAALLLAPAVAMRFTDEVAWTASDFVTAAVLLGGAALLFEGAVRLIGPGVRRVAAGVGILAVLVLVWLQLAVRLI